jgi:UDP-N-acetylglucosamine--N-acetylmuramyl-(pentapeptide) pyrophosphoryl-undecaprenol N-acetylglucosamine transferase
VLVNTDAVPGAANALLGRFAAANAVAFAGTGLPRTHLTGTPVRPELSALDRSAVGQKEARSTLALPSDRHTVAAFGGSLGARRINAAVADLAGQWSDRGDVTIYHVAGRRDFSDYAAADVDAGAGAETGAEAAKGIFYRVVEYEDRMPDLYKAADLCICRAGAMTVAELMDTGMASILVPLPGAPRDHQTRNALALVDAGAAILLPDAECSGERLAAEVSALLSDPDRLTAMGAAARALGHPDAAEQVAALVDAHAR